MSNQRPYAGYPVGVLLAEESVSVGQWDETRWILEDVVPQTESATELMLYPDERKEIRYNLESVEPVVFVICDEDEVSGNPVPRLVTLSQDEASSSMEAEALVLSVPLAPELRDWAITVLQQWEAGHVG